MVIEPPDATSLCVVNEKVVTAVETLLVNLSAAPIAMLTDSTAGTLQPCRFVPVPGQVVALLVPSPAGHVGVPDGQPQY